MYKHMVFENFKWKNWKLYIYNLSNVISKKYMHLQ
jgi:hypothetical protein